MLSKHGFYRILKHVADKGELRYNEISKAALASKIVKSRSQVDVALRMLSKPQLLVTDVHSGKPPTIIYRLSLKGDNEQESEEDSDQSGPQTTMLEQRSCSSRADLSFSVPTK